MKAVPLALCLAASACGVASANESRHAAIVDMPEVATLSHASPDTWHTLPPVQPYDESTSTAASVVNWDAEQRLRSYRGRLKEEVHEATRLN